MEVRGIKKMNKNIKDDIIKRLSSMNYEVKEKDNFILQFIIDKVEQDIKNKTNQSEVPSGLHFVFVERVCGEFLNGMRSSNMLSDEQIEATVTAIKEGDTQVSFDKDSSPQAVFGAYLKYLMNYGSDDFAKYRKFVW